jgi:hypothetical protein
MRMCGVALTVIATVGAAFLSAQQDVPPGPASTQAPPVDATQVVPSPGLGRVFGADAGLILSSVRPDKVADFENVLTRIHEALALSSDPVRGEQAAGWKAFRATEPGPNGSVLYVFVMDPAVKGADYTLSRLLSEAFPDEVRGLFRLYNGAVVGQNLVNLQLLEHFGEPVRTDVKPAAQ